jgi:hypothetical protein
MDTPNGLVAAVAVTGAAERVEKKALLPLLLRVEDGEAEDEDEGEKAKADAPDMGAVLALLEGEGDEEGDTALVGRDEALCAARGDARLALACAGLAGWWAAISWLIVSAAGMLRSRELALNVAPLFEGDPAVAVRARSGLVLRLMMALIYSKRIEHNVLHCVSFMRATDCVVVTCARVLDQVVHKDDSRTVADDVKCKPPRTGFVSKTTVFEFTDVAQFIALVPKRIVPSRRGRCADRSRHSA